MYIKSNGNIILSTMLSFSIITLICSCSFLLMKNNNELSYLYNNDCSIYNLLQTEEKELIQLNKELNKLNHEEIFIENFNLKNTYSELKYEKEKNTFYLLTQDNLCRELTYISKENKIFLIPKYENVKFEMDKEF